MQSSVSTEVSSLCFQLVITTCFMSSEIATTHKFRRNWFIYGHLPIDRATTHCQVLFKRKRAFLNTARTELREARGKTERLSLRIEFVPTFRLNSPIDRLRSSSMAKFLSRLTRHCCYPKKAEAT